MVLRGGERRGAFIRGLSSHERIPFSTVHLSYSSPAPIFLHATPVWIPSSNPLKRSTASPRNALPDSIVVPSRNKGHLRLSRQHQVPAPRKAIGLCWSAKHQVCLPGLLPFHGCSTGADAAWCRCYPQPRHGTSLFATSRRHAKLPSARTKARSLVTMVSKNSNR